MTTPITASRLVLVKAHGDSGSAPAPVVPLRRYRLARLRSTQPASSGGRFSYLKRAHD